MLELRCVQLDLVTVWLWYNVSTLVNKVKFDAETSCGAYTISGYKSLQSPFKHPRGDAGYEFTPFITKIIRKLIYTFYRFNLHSSVTAHERERFNGG